MNARVQKMITETLRSEGVEEIFKMGQVDIFDPDYCRNQIETNGLIEGVVRQSYPQSCNLNLVSCSGK
ncbi:hypothetical protein [Gimesia sp.]|uniref:hypothetical protein n=1 Tax=Gimesia sp. TaxID=2024833 RepID=UPI003A8F6493